MIGVFMSPAEYDSLFGHEIAELLKSREKGAQYRMRKRVANWKRW